MHTVRKKCSTGQRFICTEVTSYKICILVASKQSWRFFQNFVAFSEYLNFKPGTNQITGDQKNKCDFKKGWNPLWLSDGRKTVLLFSLKFSATVDMQSRKEWRTVSLHGMNQEPQYIYGHQDLFSKLPKEAGFSEIFFLNDLHEKTMYKMLY